MSRSEGEGVRTTVINIRNAPKGWFADPQFVYIGRAGKGMDGYFGNPFYLKPGESRGATILRFVGYAGKRYREDAEYRERVRGLKGKTLVCFCKPAECHGDVLARMADLPDDFLATPETRQDGEGS